MNIIDALENLTGPGHITRDKENPCSIYRWEKDTWGDFQKCRATLTIEDILATDWEVIT